MALSFPTNNRYVVIQKMNQFQIKMGNIRRKLIECNKQAITVFYIIVWCEKILAHLLCQSPHIL